MKIIFEETLAHSKAFIFILDQWVKLLKAGQGDNELPFSNSSFVCYAIDDKGVMLGASVWIYDTSRRTANVLFSAVDEQHRRKGLYTLIIQEVERRAKLKGAINLYSGVHVSNQTMIATAAKVGRKAGWYRLKKPI